LDFLLNFYVPFKYIMYIDFDVKILTSMYLYYSADKKKRKNLIDILNSLYCFEIVFDIVSK